MDKERNKLILVLLTSRTLTDNKITPELELTSLLPKKKKYNTSWCEKIGGLASHLCANVEEDVEPLVSR
jgi:hypothetical protein